MNQSCLRVTDCSYGRSKETLTARAAPLTVGLPSEFQVYSERPP